ncbi:hypothetical protein ACQ86N_01360 [Puia sp. P3]|uniref:hypothetical protein n=1 Tax=Puia sp. P3 TaxID=3423952 RepID=UPI003D66ED2B
MNIIGENQKICPDLLPTGVTGCWLDNDAAVWVYDNYDIWQLDLAGEKPAVNITHGLGRAGHIGFRLANGTRYDNNIVHTRGDSLLLVAYDMENKYNGFYRLLTGSRKGPELLVMGPWTFLHAEFSSELDGGMRPLKAGAANIWVAKRQSAMESPNFS